MSYTNTTPNYDLPQFEASDRMTPVADFNGAFSAIDTALKENADNIADMDSDVAEAKSDAESALTTANSVASTANNALLQAQTANTTAGNALSTANGATTTANSASALAEASAENLADEFDASETYIVGDYVIYNGVLYKCTVAHTGDFVSGDFTAVKIVDEMGGGAGIYKSVSVFGNAVKNFSTLLNELYATLVTAVGANEIAVESLTLGTNTETTYTCDANDHRKKAVDTHYTFNRLYPYPQTSSQQYNSINFINIDMKSSDSVYFGANINSSQTVNLASYNETVAPNNYEITLYYREF